MPVFFNLGHPSFQFRTGGNAIWDVAFCKKATSQINYNTPPIDRNNGANTNDTIVINLIRIFMDGPDVSLNGSPTVSPTTAALCASLPFPPCVPSSMYFFALSHAPPALDIKIAIMTPVTSAPASSPPSAAGPNRIPTANGDNTAMIPGTNISFNAAVVEIATQDL